jgi:histidine triad (HIT) family protein
VLNLYIYYPVKPVSAVLSVKKTITLKGIPMKDCLFCRIIKGEIPARLIYENEHAVVFNDINPQAPIHLLAIPRQHYASIHDIEKHNMEILKNLFSAVNKVIEIKDLSAKGYRLVINSGESAGQTVSHIHIHILSGRQMKWPPG